MFHNQTWILVFCPLDQSIVGCECIPYKLHIWIYEQMKKIICNFLYNYENTICRLLKTIYGLKKVQNKVTKSVQKTQLFILIKWIIINLWQLGLYVDDSVHFTKYPLLEHCKVELNEEFEMIDKRDMFHIILQFKYMRLLY